MNSIVLSSVLLLAAPVNEELAHKKAIRALLPAAASMPAQKREHLHSVTGFWNWGNHPLMQDIVVVDRGNPEAFLVQTFDKFKRKDGKLVTVVHDDCIQEFTCKIDGNRALGKVRFRVVQAYDLTAEYQARRVKGGWRIDSFHFPKSKVTTTRGKDGIWKATGAGVVDDPLSPKPGQ